MESTDASALRWEAHSAIGASLLLHPHIVTWRQVEDAKELGKVSLWVLALHDDGPLLRVWSLLALSADDRVHLLEVSAALRERGVESYNRVQARALLDDAMGEGAPSPRVFWPCWRQAGAKAHRGPGADNPLINPSVLNALVDLLVELNAGVGPAGEMDDSMLEKRIRALLRGDQVGELPVPRHGLMSAQVGAFETGVRELGSALVLAARRTRTIELLYNGRKWSFDEAKYHKIVKALAMSYQEFLPLHPSEKRAGRKIPADREVVRRRLFAFVDGHELVPRKRDGHPRKRDRQALVGWIGECIGVEDTPVPYGSQYPDRGNDYRMTERVRNFLGRDEPFAGEDDTED